MIKIDKKKVPLDVLYAIKDLRNQLKDIAEQNKDLIEFKELPDWIFFSLDKDQNSNFYFRVSDYEQNESDRKTYFKVEALPTYTSMLTPYVSKTLTQKIVETFSTWITLLKNYNEIQLSDEQVLEKKYEEEFLEYFDILDTDAEIEPFEIKQQIFLNDFIDYTITELKKDVHQDIEIAEIILQAETFKKNIPLETKRESIRSLSKIFAKIRKRSIPLIKKIGKTFVDKLVEKGVGWAVDKGEEFLLTLFN